MLLVELTFDSSDGDIGDRGRNCVPSGSEESDESDRGELHCEVRCREIW